jgi:hypothetical protein
MLLPGDAEEQTEHRLLTKDVNLEANVVKIAHHGSKYATSEDFLKRVKPQIAVISCGAWNRYGHPAQSVLDRLKAMGVKLYRTDLQGEITITTRGKEGDIVVKTAKEATEDLFVDGPHRKTILQDPDSSLTATSDHRRNRRRRRRSEVGRFGENQLRLSFLNSQRIPHTAVWGYFRSFLTRSSCIDLRASARRR